MGCAYDPEMSIRRLILAGIALMAASLAQAQLVHVAFTQPDNLVIFTADSASVPWNLAAGTVDRLDLYYDPATATGDGAGGYTFADPSRNFWRLRVSGELGAFTVRRALTGLTVFDTGLTFTHLTDSPGPEFFDFTAGFAGTISVNLALPTTSLPPLLPPLEVGGTSFVFQAGQSFFPVPHLADAVGYGGFGEASLHLEGPLAPVPEPSTYAFAAMALMSATLMLRGRVDRRGLLRPVLRQR